MAGLLPERRCLLRLATPMAPRARPPRESRRWPKALRPGHRRRASTSFTIATGAERSASRSLKSRPSRSGIRSVWK